MAYEVMKHCKASRTKLPEILSSFKFTRNVSSQTMNIYIMQRASLRPNDRLVIDLTGTTMSRYSPHICDDTRLISKTRELELSNTYVLDIDC
jgi:hypothetical protein